MACVTKPGLEEAGFEKVEKRDRDRVSMTSTPAMLYAGEASCIDTPSSQWAVEKQAPSFMASKQDLKTDIYASVL